MDLNPQLGQDFIIQKVTYLGAESGAYILMFVVLNTCISYKI